MNGNGFAKKRGGDFIFIFSSMPALTGYFFSFFDLLVVGVFFIHFFSNYRVYRVPALIFFFAMFVLTLSVLYNVETIDYKGVASFCFLIFVLYSVVHLLLSGFFSATGALYYWALGIVPAAVVVVVQQINPGLEFFNYNELKSNPLPGFDYIRASGLLYNPNSFALYSIICFLYYLFQKSYLLVFISCVSAISTFSKTFFVIPFLLVVYFFYRFKLVYLIFVLLLSVVVFFYAFDYLYGLFEYRLKNADSFSSRAEIVMYYYSQNFSFFDIFLGLGPLSDFDDVGRIHNKYLSVLYQFGVLGFLLSMVFFVYPLFVLMKSNSDKGVWLFVFLSLVSIYLIGMVSTFTFFTFDYVILILLAAFVKENSESF